MYGGGGSACPCLRPLFGAIAVGVLKIFTGPLSMLGLYWTVFIFLGSEAQPRELDTNIYRANGEELLQMHNTYSFEVLKNIFYTFFLPACFPAVSGICVFISVIKKSSKFLHWALILNLVFIASSVLVIILICSQGIKFLATLPLLAMTMVHVYFLVVISLFKEWVHATNYYSERENPVSTNEKRNGTTTTTTTTTTTKRPPPPPIPPRTSTNTASTTGPKSIMAHSNGNYYNSPYEQNLNRTRVVTVTSV